MAKTQTECGVCGYETATHYYETDTIHDAGAGEYMCCACDGHDKRECK